jgi:hypothetical protein
MNARIEIAAGKLALRAPTRVGLRSTLTIRSRYFSMISSHGFRRALPVFVSACAFTALASLAPNAAAPVRAQSPSSRPPIYVGERWLCRPPDASTTANGTMAGGTEPLRCTPLNVTLTATNGQVDVVGNPQADASGNEERISVTSPNYTGTISGKDLHDSWVDMVKKGLQTGETVNVGDRWVCRRADAGHPANASMTSAGAGVPLSCRSVNGTIQTSTGQMIVIGSVRARPPSAAPMMTSPPYSSGLSVEQQNANWNAYVNRVFDIATSAAGGG